MAAELGVPRLIFVNKLDRERASFERTLDQLRERCGAGVAPLELPIGSEVDFRGVADLLTDRAFTYADGGTPTEGDIAAPPERVYEHRLDFTQLPLINPNVSNLERTDGSAEPGVGAAYKFDTTIEGMGNHPEFLRFMVNLAQFVREAGPVTPSTPTPPAQRYTATNLYPDQPNKG